MLRLIAVLVAAAVPLVGAASAWALKQQKIEFTSTPPAHATVGSEYSVTAKASSNQPVTLSIDAPSASVCSIASGSKVTFNAAGSCVIDANQGGNFEYEAAPQVQQQVPVGEQEIVFTSARPHEPVTIGSTYEVTAEATSKLPVGLTIDATSEGACSLPPGSTSPAAVTFEKAGTCRIDANQAGNTAWQPAAQRQFVITVAARTQEVNFTSVAPTAAMVNGPEYEVIAEATPSKLLVSLSVDTSSLAICKLSGPSSPARVSFLSAGPCVIDASQAGNSEYAPALPKQQSFTISKKPQTIEFTTEPPKAAVVGGPTYTVGARSSGGSVTFVVDGASA